MRRAYFCIDGFSFKRINDFYKYEHKRHSRLNVAAMETYLRYEIERRFEWKSDFGNLMVEKHFYHPDRNQQRDSEFEKNLIISGYNIHYANENIFAEWVIARELRKFDIFILLSTQKKYADIFRQTKICRIPSMLIGWESRCKNSAGRDSKWKTDQHLIENASCYCPLDRILNQSNSKKMPLVEIMFETFFPRYLSAPRCG
jgi:hypothetical protein